jgi:protein-tyrosine-phosphatase
MSGKSATWNMLFVCTGNTCRSPMAEVIARKAIEERGWSHVRVGSAGVAADAGSLATDTAVKALAEAGLDLSGHRARRVDRALLDWADLVLVMSPSHLKALDQLGGAEKSVLLGDFAGAGGAVHDPFGGDLATYRATRRELERLVEVSLDRIAEIVIP